MLYDTTVLLMWGITPVASTEMAKNKLFILLTLQATRSVQL